MKQKWKLYKIINKDKRLNDAARRVAFSLLDRENNKTKKLFPSHQRIAMDSSLSLRSVKRGIKNLIDFNYLSRIKVGFTGRATEYSINYDLLLMERVPELSKEGATFVQRGGQICPKRVPHLAHQLTNTKLTYKLTNNKLTVEDKKDILIDTNKMEKKRKEIDYTIDHSIKVNDTYKKPNKEVRDILSRFVKGMNPNYRRVVDGSKLKYLDPESIRRRYVDKTNDYDKSYEWLQKYMNPKTSKEAWDYAVYIGIVKEFKNNQ